MIAPDEKHDPRSLFIGAYPKPYLSAGTLPLEEVGESDHDWEPFTFSIALIGIYPGQIWRESGLLSSLVLTRAVGLISSAQPAAFAQLNSRGFILLPQRELWVQIGLARTHLIGDGTCDLFKVNPADLPSASEVWRHAKAAGRSVPMKSGWVIRQNQDGSVAVDIEALAFKVFDEGSPMLGGGREGLVRGKQFELVIQELVDSTPWVPPKTLREMVGRDLRNQRGTKETDLDAVALKGSTALFIQCKSYVAKGAANTIYEGVTNVKMKLAKDLQYWRQKVLLLGRERGSNYDFSYLDQIVPVICVSGAPYLPLDIAEEMAIGELRAICTPEELLRFLEAVD